MQDLALGEMTLDVDQEIEIQAKIETVFEGLVHRFENLIAEDGESVLPLRLERWPGGRWFRDLGDEKGHLWGFVQSIKPPALLEIWGPMFMSYPVSGHIIVRLEEVSSGTKVHLRHRAFGLLQEDHRVGVVDGWKRVLDAVKSDSEKVSA